VITFTCSSCGKSTEATDALVGKTAVCRSCGAFVDVPLGWPARSPAPDTETRCPKCQAKIPAGAKECGFCGHDLSATTPTVSAAAGPRIAPSRIRVLLLLAWTVTAAIAGLSFLGGGSDGGLVPPEQVCRGHLELLHAAILRYVSAHGTAPNAKGTAFWQVIAEAEGEGSALSCPLAGAKPVYRGPAGRWEVIPETGVVACDREGVHPEGMTVLLKNGQVEFAPRGSDLHQRALRETAE